MGKQIVTPQSFLSICKSKDAKSVKIVVKKTNVKKFVVSTKKSKFTLSVQSDDIANMILSQIPHELVSIEKPKVQVN